MLPPNPSEAVQRAIQHRISQLSMLPAVAMEAMQMAREPDCSVSKLSSLIERDAKLASDILSLANSAAYGVTQPIANLREAIVRLGLRQSRNLIISSSVNSLMRRVSLNEQWIRELLGQHAFATALAAAHLNRALNVGFQGEEFTAGLVHDIGRLLVAVLAQERFSQADPLSFDESAEVLEAERLVTQTDHCEIGAWFAASNHLPHEIVHVIFFHHTPDIAPQHRKLVALTAAADHAANYLQRTENPEGYEAADNSAIRSLEQAGCPHAVTRFREIAPAFLHATHRDIERSAQLC